MLTVQLHSTEPRIRVFAYIEGLHFLLMPDRGTKDMTSSDKPTADTRIAAAQVA